MPLRASLEGYFFVRRFRAFDLLDLGSYRDVAIVSPRAFWSFESERRPRG